MAQPLPVPAINSYSLVIHLVVLFVYKTIVFFKRLIGLLKRSSLVVESDTFLKETPSALSTLTQGGSTSQSKIITNIS